MRPNPQDALDRWLAAERGDHAEEADAALFELFEALPLAAPPAGFADRVLARAGIAAVPAAAPVRWRLFASRPAWLLLGLCVAAVAFGLLWLPPVVELMARLWSFGDLVQAGVSAFNSLMQRLASAFRFGESLFSIGRAVSQPLTDPWLMAVLMGCLAVSSLAFRFLRDQVSGERNMTYVDPI
jgi:hypothetical protein